MDDRVRTDRPLFYLAGVSLSSEEVCTMPSPFPGMDPYLEEPSGWPSMHHRLISTIGDTLIAQLVPHYLVSIEERVYITDDEDPESRQQIAPDVYIVERAGPHAFSTAETITVTPPTIIERLPALEVRDRYLSIYDRKSRELVTTLEILSPRNKAKRSRGRREFMSKRNVVFSTRTNWIEIDLLRAGERPEEVAGNSDYYTLLHRAHAGGRLEVWYTDLRDHLPTISVPLREPHPDVLLDLQVALDRVYERAYYADQIDYTEAVPQPLLRPADAAWAAERVQQWLARQAPEAE
jgi:hypothetical protein